MYSTLNGQKIDASIGQSLDIQTGCVVTWVPFTAGDPVPDGAVEGGYLDNDGVIQNLYITSVLKTQHNCIVFGYYNPATELGYAEDFDVFTYTDMNLLILWSQPRRSNWYM